MYCGQTISSSWQHSIQLSSCSCRDSRAFKSFLLMPSKMALRRTAQFKKFESFPGQPSALRRRDNARQVFTKRKWQTSTEETFSKAQLGLSAWTLLELVWDRPFRRWRIVTIVGSAGQDKVLLRYLIDDSTTWIALNTIQQRFINACEPSTAQRERPKPSPEGVVFSVGALSAF